MEKRPDFETLASYEEFKKYYWYRKELSGICRRLGIEYRGTKQELNHPYRRVLLREIGGKERCTAPF